MFKMLTFYEQVENWQSITRALWFDFFKLSVVWIDSHEIAHPLWGGDVAQLGERRNGTSLTSIPRCSKGFFPPRVNFQCRLSYGVRTPPCKIACIYICAHVKDPVVYVRVRQIMRTLKHPACTVGWVARPCRRWLSPGKATQISHGKISMEKCSC